jgi:hypothetical protein
VIGWPYESRRPHLFRKRWFEPTVIVTCVRWYLRFSLHAQAAFHHDPLPNRGASGSSASTIGRKDDHLILKMAPGNKAGLLFCIQFTLSNPGSDHFAKELAICLPQARWELSIHQWHYLHKWVNCNSQNRCHGAGEQNDCSRRTWSSPYKARPH